MNTTQLKACFQSDNFRLRLHAALRNTAINKHGVAHIKNRKGSNILAVRYDRIKGFSFLSKTGDELKTQVLDLLKMVA